MCIPVAHLKVGQLPGFAIYTTTVMLCLLKIFEVFVFACKHCWRHGSHPVESSSSSSGLDASSSSESLTDSEKRLQPAGSSASLPPLGSTIQPVCVDVWAGS